jgi:collagenase-like PrtC family protease
VSELICPAGNPAALRTAIEAGADAVYVGFADDTNARNFPGLNFSRPAMHLAVQTAHAAGRKLLIAINSFPRAGEQALWHRAVDDAAEMGADAVILADIGLLDYASKKHPGLRLHLSVQASASSPEAIRFYHEAFGVKRVVLPRVLTVEEIAELCSQIPVEAEVFVFGGLCVMAEGRCSLSSYATGKSPNMNGVCSPAEQVRYTEVDGKTVSQLGEFTINQFDISEPAGYPTLCKGRFKASGKLGYLFEEPTSLNTMELLPQLIAAGVTAFKIEGRQRGRAYVAQVVSSFRQALDGNTAVALEGLTEGGRQTAGAYQRSWR